MPSSDTNAGTEATEDRAAGRPAERADLPGHTGSGATAAPGRSRQWQTGTPFLVGVNVPWLRYGGDIGSNDWAPEGGVGAPSRRHDLDRSCARLADAAVRAVRWFLLCDGRAGVQVDDRGRPAGLDARVRRDLDALLDALHRHALRAILVLFDFPMVHPARRVGGVPVFGRRRWISDPDAQARLLEHVVAPLVHHVQDAGVVLAWDVMNEPDRATLGHGSWRPWRAVQPRAMRRFLRASVTTLRAHSRHAITVGLGSHRGLALVQDLGLDLYQVHWYDHVAPASVLAIDVDRFAIDGPLLLGEYPVQGSALPPATILETVHRAGYAGAFGWSFAADDRYSDPDVCLREVAAWRPPQPSHTLT